MNFGINKKISIMGLLVLTLFLILMYFSNNVIKQLTNDIELSKKLGQLEQLVDLMADSSEKYQENAPRDYDSYNRDLKVFYGRLNENIKNLDQLTQSTTHNYFNRTSIAGFLINDNITDKNNLAFKQLVNAKNIFDKGYNEKIGDNKEEPRLEWANEYISNDSSGLIAKVKNANLQFDQLLLAHEKATFTFNNIVSVIIAVVFIALILWINLTVVKRILRVAKACREVSLGNYGLQVKDKHTDEIGVLVKDFNQLSSRLKSVLSILSELNNTNTEQEALTIIKKETQTLIDAAALFLLTPIENGYKIKSITNSKAKTDLSNKDLMSDDSCVSWVKTQKSHLLINDILSHTFSQKNSHMAKLLLHSTNANSLMVLRITDKNKNGLLLISKSQKNGFTEQHAETLNNLSSLFGRSLLN